MKNNPLKTLLFLLPVPLAMMASACQGDNSQTQGKVLVESIEFRTEVSDVYVGHSTYITGVRVLPSNATNKELLWTVIDPSVAEIDSSGNVNGLKAGSTKIVASAKDGSGIKKELDFTVKPLEAPSSWELDTAYTFYVSDTFKPNITMYPDTAYIDREVEYEVVEGEDVLKVVNGEIGAYKSGTGKVKVTSKANPSLTGVISCVADGDLISKYGYKEIWGNAEAKVLSTRGDRYSLLNFKAPVIRGGWPSLIIEFDKMLDTKEFSMDLDALSVSGAQWYSVRLAKDGNPYAETEMNAELHGGKPLLDQWTTNSFDYTSFDLKFNQLFITINADMDYQEGKHDPYVEIVFDNLSFPEFVDNPTAISLKDSDVLLPLGGKSDIEVVFTPRYVRNTDLVYTVKPGSESVVKVEDGKLVGLDEGVGYVEVASAGNPSAKTEAKVTVSSELMINLDVMDVDGITKDQFASKDGKEAVTSLSAPTTVGDRYPSITYALPSEIEANKLHVIVDAKMISGQQWFSISPMANGGSLRLQEIGCGEGSREWKTYHFDFAAVGVADSIRFTFNTQVDASGSEMMETLFTNLHIELY